MTFRALAWFVLIHLLLGGVYLWTFREQTVVRVEVRGEKMAAYLDGVLMSEVRLNAPMTGEVGLYLRHDDFPQAWDGWEVRDEWGRLLHADAFAGQTNGEWKMHPFPWRVSLLGDYRAEVNLSQNRGDFSLAVAPVSFPGNGSVQATFLRAQNGGLYLGQGISGRQFSGVVLLVRPRLNDCYWMLMDSAQPIGIHPEGSRRYTPSWPTNLKGIAYRLLSNYFTGWGFVGVTALLVLALLTALLPIAGLLRSLTDKLAAAAEWLGPVTGKLTWQAAVWLLAVSAFLTSQWFNVEVLEKIPHVQDSIATLFQGKVFARGELTAPIPQPYSAFEFEMIIAHKGQWYSKYTVGHPIVMVPFVWLEREWLCGPFVGAVTVVAAAVLAGAVFGPWTGLLAAALLAVSPQFLIMSASFMSHSSTLMWLVLFNLAIYRFYCKPSWSWALLGGLFLSMTGVGRPFTGVLCGFPGGLVVLLSWWRWRTLGVVARSFGFLLGAVPLVAFQLYFNYHTLEHPLKFGYQHYWPNDKLGFGAVGNFGEHTPTTAVHNVLLNLMELQPFLFGWPWWLALSLVPLAFFAPRQRWWSLYLLSNWLMLVLGYFFWWYHGISYGPRFWYEGVASLVILTAHGALTAAELVVRGVQRLTWYQRFGERLPQAVGGLVAVGLLAWTSYSAAWPYFKRLAAHDYRAYNYTWAKIIKMKDEQKITNAVIFVDGKLFWSEFGSVFSQNSPWLDTDIIYARHVNDTTTLEVKQNYPQKRYYFYNGETLQEMQ